MELYFRHHTPRRIPARGLVEEAFVPDHRLVAWSSHWPRQQLRDVALQAVVGRDADGVLRAPLLQRFVDLWLGEGCVGPKHHLLAQLLLPLDLRQQELLPTLGAVHVAGPSLGCQTITLAVEQQQLLRRPGFWQTQKRSRWLSFSLRQRSIFVIRDKLTERQSICRQWT